MHTVVGILMIILIVGAFILVERIGKRTFYHDIILPPKDKRKLLKEQREEFWDRTITSSFLNKLKEIENSLYEKKFETIIDTSIDHYLVDLKILHKIRKNFEKKGWCCAFNVKIESIENKATWTICIHNVGGR